MKFSNSCKTIALKQENIFISAFPGAIIFGEVCPTGFLENKCFRFNHYQLFELYLALVSLIKFHISEAENSNEKGIILTLRNEELYYWCASKIIFNQTETKIIKFGIEQKLQTVFELLLEYEDLNNLINALSQMILPCLCLNPLERSIFDFASEQDITTLVTLTNPKIIEQFINTYEIKKDVKIDLIIKPNIVGNLIYYNEILIILQKLKTIFNPEMSIKNRIELLLDIN